MHLAPARPASDSVIEVRPNRTVIESTITAALGGLLFGFDTAVIAGITGALSDKFHLSATSLGFTVAIALWGTILGAATGGFAGNRFGRRDSLRALAVLFIANEALRKRSAQLEYRGRVQSHYVVPVVESQSTAGPRLEVPELPQLCLREKFP